MGEDLSAVSVAVEVNLQSLRTDLAAMEKQIANSTTRANQAMKLRPTIDRSVEQAISRQQAGRSLAGADEMGKATGKGAGEEGGFEKDFRAMKKFGKAIGEASALVDIARVGVAAYHKDWDAVGEVVKGLPFGIGEISGAVMDLKAELTGAKKELEALQETAKRNDATNAFKRHSADVIKGVRETGAEFVQQSLERNTGIGKTGLDATLYGIDTDAAQKKRALLKEQKDKIKDSGEDEGSAAAQKIRDVYSKDIAMADAETANLRRDAMNKDRRERLDAIAESESQTGAIALQLQHKNIEAQVKLIEDGAKAKADAERRNGHGDVADAIEANAAAQKSLVIQTEANRKEDSLFDISNEMKQNQLQREHKLDESAVQSIKDSFAKRIQAAQDAGGREDEIAQMRLDRDQQVKNLEAQQAEDQADRMKSIHAETAAQILQLQGKDFEAQIVQQKEAFEERIQAAHKAGHEEEAQAIEVQERIAMVAAAKQKAIEDSSHQFTQLAQGSHVTGAGYAMAYAANLKSTTSAIGGAVTGDKPMALDTATIAAMGKAIADAIRGVPAVAA